MGNHFTLTTTLKFPHDNPQISIHVKVHKMASNDYKEAITVDYRE